MICFLFIIVFLLSNGYSCPENYNPADFFINTLAISPFDRENSKNRVQAICDSFQSSQYFEILNKEIDPSDANNKSILIEPDNRHEN